MPHEEPCRTSPSTWVVASRSAGRSAASTATGLLDHGDVDLSHRHHRLEGTLGCCPVGVADRVRQRTWGDLPGQAPFVLAPAALALLPAVADDGIPQAIGLGLIVGCHLERKGLAVLDRG